MPGAPFHSCIKAGKTAGPAHEGGELLDPLQGKGGRVRGFRAMDMSFMGVVVRRHPVGVENAAPLAAVDDGPLAAFAHPDTHWLHDVAAVRRPVPGSSSRWRLRRQLGAVVAVLPSPVGAGVTRRPHTLQVKLSWQGCVL